MYMYLRNCLSIIGSEAFHNAEFGEGIGGILLEGLECVGTEDSLLDCDMDVQLGLTLCDHSHDAGIRCHGTYVIIIISSSHTCSLCI